MNEFYLIKSKISTFVVFSIIAVSILVLFTGISFTQDIQTQKMLSPEDLIARENYIYTRRAGGPGMVIPQDVLSKALQQKALLPEHAAPLEREHPGAIGGEVLAPQPPVHRQAAVEAVEPRIHRLREPAAPHHMGRVRQQ